MTKCKDCGYENHPGKFEAEPHYSEYFYTMVLDGASDSTFDDGDAPVDRFTVDANDVARFPCCLTAVDVGKVVFLWEDEQGFVWTGLMSVAEADAIQAQCEG